MLKKSSNELQIARPTEPVATVEVDIDSLPEGHHGCAEIIREALTPFVSAHPTMMATCYIAVRPSTTFLRPTYSAFIGIAGPGVFLQEVLRTFSSIAGVDARRGDDMLARDGRCELHVQDGRFWQSDEPGSWYSWQDNDTVAAPHDDDGKADVSAAINDPVSPETQRSPDSERQEMPARFRAARADAPVGTIRATIESIFGLPTGSVALCGPDGKALRADASIRTLRKRWEK